MNRKLIGEFISEKIVETFDGPKGYVKVYVIETNEGSNYIAITKDSQEYEIKQTSDNSFCMTIGEDTYNIYPEDGDNPEF